MATEQELHDAIDKQELAPLETSILKKLATNKSPMGQVDLGVNDSAGTSALSKLVHLGFLTKKSGGIFGTDTYSLHLESLN